MEPIRGRRNNHRLYPGAKHRADLALTRQQEAKERQTAYDKLTVQEKLNRLPTGGANRQRARLATVQQNRIDEINKKITDAGAPYPILRSTHDNEERNATIRKEEEDRAMKRESVRVEEMKKLSR